MLAYACEQGMQIIAVAPFPGRVISACALFQFRYADNKHAVGIIAERTVHVVCIDYYRVENYPGYNGDEYQFGKQPAVVQAAVPQILYYRAEHWFISFGSTIRLSGDAVTTMPGSKLTIC